LCFEPEKKLKNLDKNKQIKKVKDVKLYEDKKE